MLRCSSSASVPAMTPQDPSSASDRDPVRAEKNQPADRESVRTAGSTEGMPVAPALGASLDQAKMPLKSTLVDRRILLISALAIVLGAAAAVVAQLLMLMINLITDLVFYGRISDVIGPNAQHGSFVLSPAGNHLGALVILMPVIGGLAAGIMARWGSRAIQGHGIPEAMERILEHESNIPARVTWLKPLSSAFAIGTGGPFGAEGPIISTGGAMGSLIGQLLSVTAQERKVLLAAGAAAGMAAVFGAPIASVVMAIELLLFELRPRSLIPVALASGIAVGVRYMIYGAGAVFAMPNVSEPGGWALGTYMVLGLLVGYASVWVTRAVYGVEDTFAKLPIHWMW
jgi:H+/Cl- antiporter ClcA